MRLITVNSDSTCVIHHLNLLLHAWCIHFFYYSIICINLLCLAAISFPNLLHQPFFTPDLFSRGPVTEIHLSFFFFLFSNSLCFYSTHAFLLFFPPSRFCLCSLSLPPSFCLNLLSLMSPSRESQARKKGRGLTEIDVWALPLIRWLNPSINMQRRCPMQMDPIRRNGVVLSVCCGE